MDNKPELFHAPRTPRRPPAGLMFLALVFALIAGYISVFVFSLAPSPAKAANLRQELGTPTAPILTTPTPNLTAIAAEADAARAQSTAAHDSMRAAATMQAVESIRQLNLQAEATQAALKLTMQANDATQTAAAVVADSIAAENALKRSKAEAEIIRAEYEMEATNAAIMRDNYIIPGLGAFAVLAVLILGVVFLNRIQPTPARVPVTVPAPEKAAPVFDLNSIAAPEPKDEAWAGWPDMYRVGSLTVTKIHQMFPSAKVAVTFAAAMAAGGEPTFRPWAKRNRQEDPEPLFTESQFTALQTALAAHGMAEWEDPEERRGGLSLTEAGRAFFAALAAVELE